MIHHEFLENDLVQLCYSGAGDNLRSALFLALEVRVSDDSSMRLALELRSIKILPLVASNVLPGFICLWIAPCFPVLTKVPCAHLIALLLRIWSITMERLGEQARCHSYQRLGSVVRIGHHELSINCIADGVQNAYRNSSKTNTMLWTILPRLNRVYLNDFTTAWLFRRGHGMDLPYDYVAVDGFLVPLQETFWWFHMA